jgi:hypothetical protein
MDMNGDLERRVIKEHEYARSLRDGISMVISTAPTN